ncbi:hypothetical protein LTR66_011516, partial [Elasticomyces elasticus]
MARDIAPADATDSFPSRNGSSVGEHGVRVNGNLDGHGEPIEIACDHDDIPTDHLHHTPPLASADTVPTSSPKSPRQYAGVPIQQHRYSTASTAVPQRKEKVRYSWQSVQDEEPNRPRIHIIKLVSTSATASAGFPHGEAFGFSISPRGRRVAAYNSARLFILQTAVLPVGLTQEYALRRRPLAVDIVDDGNMLAVLADEHTVNIYHLSHSRLRRIKTLKLDFPTSTIALSSTGGLLAAAYEGGVEVFSLDASALSTDRRAVRTPRMDRLVFSEDGSTLLGTTTRVNASSTVVISRPVYPAAKDGTPTHAELKEAWCTEMLHPENIRNSSHATFLREDTALCNEKLFAWNGLAEGFGILDIADTSDMHYTNIDFPVQIAPPLSTLGGLGAVIHSAPTIDELGDTVAMVINHRTIRLYIIPHKGKNEEESIEAHSIDHELDEGYGCPFSDVRWVHSNWRLHPSSPTGQSDSPGAQIRGRLICVSPGGVVDQGLPEESVQDIEGGRIILLDFDPQYADQPGQTFVLNLGKSPPQTLEEEEMDVQTEVALVRRRTVNQNKSGAASQRAISLGRAATTFSARNPQSSPNSGLQQSPLSTHPPPAFSARRSLLSMNNSNASVSLPDLLETTAEAPEEPYAQNAPRSQVSLQRAATAANRHRYQAIEEQRQNTDSQSTERFVALPEYTEEPNAPLPRRYRALAGLDIPTTPFRPAGSSSSPVSAPAMATQPHPLEGVGEPYESRPRSAAASVAPAISDQTFPPVSRSATEDSTVATPALNSNLQRAYSNAISPIGPSSSAVAFPPMTGDWDNVSPIVGRNEIPAVAAVALLPLAQVSPPLDTITAPPGPARPDRPETPQSRPPSSMAPIAVQSSLDVHGLPRRNSLETLPAGHHRRQAQASARHSMLSPPTQPILREQNASAAAAASLDRTSSTHHQRRTRPAHAHAHAPPH